MSLFGAMSTAISGMSAQSSAFGNISDNVANSQTVGYKRVDTSFIDYLTTSTASQNVPGSARRRLSDGQERLPSELGRLIPQRVAGCSNDRRGEPEYSGAHPGVADRVQSDSHGKR